jgi:hypothetical protein
VAQAVAVALEGEDLGVVDEAFDHHAASRHEGRALGDVLKLSSAAQTA